MRLYSRFWPGLQLPEGLTEAGGSTPKMAHTHGWQVGGGCWQEAWLLFMQASPQGCLVSSQHGSLMNDQERAMRKNNVFYVFILKLILHDFHNILLTISVSPIQCGKGLYKGMDTRSQESLRFIVKADYQVLLDLLSPHYLPHQYSVRSSVLPSKHLPHYMIICSNLSSTKAETPSVWFNNQHKP